MGEHSSAYAAQEILENITHKEVKSFYRKSGILDLQRYLYDSN